MRNAGAVLLRNAQDDGLVREDIDMIDLLRLMHGIVLASEQARDDQRVDGMFNLVIAGIRR
jgi:hypothetical protein